MGTFFVSPSFPNPFGEPALNLWLSIAGYTYIINLSFQRERFLTKKAKR